jgi:hypothetical protein
MLTRLGVMAAHPGAFGILIVYAVLWFIFDRDSFNWHAGATLIVWFMTLLIGANERSTFESVHHLTRRFSIRVRLPPTWQAQDPVSGLAGQNRTKCD